MYFKFINNLKPHACDVTISPIVTPFWVEPISHLTHKPNLTLFCNIPVQILSKMRAWGEKGRKVFKKEKNVYTDTYI